MTERSSRGDNVPHANTSAVMIARSAAVTVSPPARCHRVGLLAGHVHAQFGFGGVDELSADVHRHTFDGAGGIERAGVVVSDRGAGVGTAGERAGIEDEWR